jgi:hypothetical protein
VGWGAISRTLMYMVAISGGILKRDGMDLWGLEADELPLRAFEHTNGLPPEFIAWHSWEATQTDVQRLRVGQSWVCPVVKGPLGRGHLL